MSTAEARKESRSPSSGLVVGVQGDVVDEVVRLLEDRRLPLGEGRHGLAGGAAGDEFDVRVDLAHRAGRLGGDPAVLLGRLVAGLPGAVHLVAQAPQPDAEGVLVAVRRRAGRTGRCRTVWLAYSWSSRASATPRVPRLTAIIGSACGPIFRRKAMYSERPKRLVSVERQARSSRRGRSSAGPTRVLPLVAGDEVAAGVADGGDAEFADQVQDVGAQALARRPWGGPVRRCRCRRSGRGVRRRSRRGGG